MAESRFGGVPDCETGNAVLITHALDELVGNAPPLFYKPT
jgi:hypothetical protein